MDEIKCKSCGKSIIANNVRTKFCSYKCKQDFGKSHFRTIDCKCCGKTVTQALRYGFFCAKCRQQKQLKKQQSMPKKVKRGNDWEGYSKWLKQNPGRNYGDYQTEKRKASGEIV